MTGVRVIDPERRQVIWKTRIAGMGFSLPRFSVFDTFSGQRQTVAVIPFDAIFRASWVDDERALMVDRLENTTHLVLFDRFWERRSEQRLQ